jgi:hypothetical protein
MMIVLQILVVSVLLTAGEGREAKGDVEEVLAGPRWEVAPEVSYYRYAEPGTMKIGGLLYGVAASYTCYRPRGLFRVDGEFAFGLVDYEGSLLDGTPYTMEDSYDFLLNLRLLWGQSWPMDGWDNLFYAGLGYRGLNDCSIQDPAGYDRQSNYFYVPVGLKTYHKLTGHWRIGVGGEFDLLLLGVQISGVDDNSAVVNMQCPGFGARASLELRHRAKSADLALAPFVQYWWVEESNTSDGWYEPRNNTIQYGLSLVWRF